MAPFEEELYVDEDTMRLVAGALLNSGLTKEQTVNAINEMFDVGIVFREYVGNRRMMDTIKKGSDIHESQDDVMRRHKHGLAGLAAWVNEGN